MLDKIAPEPGETHLRDSSEADYYAAKRKAAAVLGHKVRPGDLPSDSEVREQALELIRSEQSAEPQESPQLEEGEELDRLADHVDRFVLYKLRLTPLERVKLNPKTHPEGDALYHSLQVFDRARDLRPYDEEFLLAALLHDVGRAIDPSNRAATAVEALRGAVTDRTLWLIAHHHGSMDSSTKTAVPPADAQEWLDDLKLLGEIDRAGRIPGAIVGTVEEALDYLKGLEAEEYLDS